MCSLLCVRWSATSSVGFTLSLLLLVGMNLHKTTHCLSLSLAHLSASWPWHRGRSASSNGSLVLDFGTVFQVADKPSTPLMKVFIYSPLLSLSLICYRWLFPWLWEEGFICTIHPCKQPEDSFLVVPSIPGYFLHPLTRLETSWPPFGPSTTALLFASESLHVLSLFLVGLGSLSLSCKHSDQVWTLWSASSL